MTAAPITGSMLYDLVSCPHRVHMDLYGDSDQRDAPNAFVQLLWEKGMLYERELMSGPGGPVLDLSRYRGEEKAQRTREAMERGEPLIYGGRIQVDGLLGDPDLLRQEGIGYIAGDIKSGSGEEGEGDSARPKKTYAVQLALYTDILERTGQSAGRWGFIWDVHGEEVIYDFTAALGQRNTKTLWEFYQDCLADAEAIVAERLITRAAYSSGICKLCHWYTVCMDQLTEANDLTLIPELGRSKRDAMLEHVATIAEFAEADVDAFISGRRTVFTGIGPQTLTTLHARARLITQGADGVPYLRDVVTLPHADVELFFDIEVDPMRDLCYLHGFVERRDGDNGSERFVAFFADEPTDASERQAFADAVAYMQASHPCAIYYYSKYERTIYRKLQQKYPDVCSADVIEQLFDPSSSVDLYFDVVKRATEWPTRDFSIKTLARYLGFDWRDTHPSGAASIEWFDRWVETGDIQIKQRILDYNEDDCRATRVLLDGIRGLSTL